jgi:hypothetical protein
METTTTDRLGWLSSICCDYQDKIDEYEKHVKEIFERASTFPFQRSLLFMHNNMKSTDGGILSYYIKQLSNVDNQIVQSVTVDMFYLTFTNENATESCRIRI